MGLALRLNLLSVPLSFSGFVFPSEENLAARFISSQGLTTTESGVTDWADKSGNGNNAARTLNFMQVQTPLNGFTTIGSGSSAYLDHTPFSSGAAWEFFIVAKADGDSMLISQAGANRQVRINRAGANVASFFNGAGEVVSSTLSKDVSEWAVYRFSQSDTDVKIEQDGTNFFDGTIASGSSTWGRIGSPTFNASLAEIIIYDTALIDDEADLITSMLLSKYSL